MAIDMKILIKLILLVTLFNVNIGVYAAEIKNDSLQFSGQINDIDNKYGKIVFKVSYSENDEIDHKYVKRYIEISTNGQFKFKLPNLNRPYKIFMVLLSNVDPNDRILIGSNFYTEPGDDIKVNIILGAKERSINFSGKGSDKYNLVQILDGRPIDSKSELQNILGEPWGSIKDSADLEIKMNTFAEILKKKNIEKAELLNSAKISSKIRFLMDKEYANYNGQWLGVADTYYTKYPALRKKLSNIYFKHNKEFNDAIQPDSLMVYCSYYMRILGMKIALEQLMTSPTEKLTISQNYKFIKTNFSGRAREILIRNCLLERETGTFVEFFNHATIAPLLKDAVQIVQIPHLKKLLSEKLALEEQNTQKVIDASFNTVDGKKLYLSSLRGKVVLVDVWFNGCFACATLNQYFEQSVYPNFKDDENFVVLSINVDESEERWFSGIASKRYTSESHMNVTTGNWFNHPFLKYYGAMAGPWMMLIDADGSIRYQPNGVTADKMNEQIREALLEAKVTSNKNSLN